MSPSTLVKNCILLPMEKDVHHPGDYYYSGELGIRDGMITVVGPVGAGADQQWDEVIDARGMVVMPGLINCHTHGAMTLLRGYADDLPLMQWLEQKIWPLESRLENEDVYWGSMLCMLEMIQSGTTTFADMYFAMDKVAEAVEQSGLRALLARGLIGVQPNGQAALAEGVALVRDWHGAAEGRITCMLGPHAPYTCPPEYLKQVCAKAEKLGVGLHIHVAETEGEVQRAVSQWGKTPVAHLADLGVFDLPVLAAHCVHVTAEDIQILRQHGVAVAHNPESNMKLASGVAPVPKMLEAGVVVGLGTDGAASNNNLDMLQEMRTAALLHKVSSGNPTVLASYQALAMATNQGARALGLQHRVGTLAPGMAADVIFVNMDQPHLWPLHDVPAHLVYAAQAGDVDTVIVNGRILMQGRQVKTLDVERIRWEVRRRAARLTATSLDKEHLV